MEKIKSNKDRSYLKTGNKSTPMYSQPPRKSKVAQCVFFMIRFARPSNKEMAMELSIIILDSNMILYFIVNKIWYSFVFHI